MPETPEGCVKPTAGPIINQKAQPSETYTATKEVSMSLARVGKHAPDFELSAFQGGGFKNIRLSDLKGRWIVVCFYPGDFTFV